MTGILCQVYEHRSGAPGEGKVVLCQRCKKGCHSVSCSQMLFRVDPRDKRVRVRVCDACRHEHSEEYSDLPPREPIRTTQTVHGRIYRNRP